MLQKVHKFYYLIIVVIISGKFQVKYNDGKDMVEAIAGQTLLLPKGIKYEYIFPTGICNYVPICFPAFRLI